MINYSIHVANETELASQLSQGVALILCFGTQIATYFEELVDGLGAEDEEAASFARFF